MFKLTPHSAKTQAFLLSGLQAGLILVCFLCWLLLAGWHAGYSALAGGMVWLLPNLYFTYKVFRYRAGRNARQTIRVFYWNEMVKLILTGALFIISLSKLSVILMPFFSGFISAMLAVWLTPCYMLCYAVSKP